MTVIPAPAADAAELLRWFERRAPQAVKLARLVSLASRVEPALLRDARLAAGLEAGAEADLWFSPMVSGAGRLGLSLSREVADILRRQLAAEPTERDRAWALVRRHHGRAPWSMRLEEQINYASMLPEDQATVAIKGLLSAALVELRSVRETDERAALGIARWLLACVGRLPAVARATPEAAVAGVAARAHLDGRLRGIDELPEDARAGWLPWLLDRLDPVPLPVRMVEGGVAVGGPASARPQVPVPDTNPLALTASWTEEGGSVDIDLQLAAGEEKLVLSGGARTVELRTIDGGHYLLRRAGLGRVGPSAGSGALAIAIAPELVVTAYEALESSDGDIATFTPDGDEPMIEVESVSDAARDLGAVGVRLARPAPIVMPIAAAYHGLRCRVGLMTSSGNGAPSATVLSGAEERGGAMRLRLDVSTDMETLGALAGSPLTVEDPWGAVVGLLRGPDWESSDPTVFVRAAAMTDVANTLESETAEVRTEAPTEVSWKRRPLQLMRPPSDPGNYDSIVVGSGAGAAVVASDLVSSGRRVLVVERGPYVDESQMRRGTPAGDVRLVEETSIDVRLRQGRGVGGSTLLSDGFIMPPSLEAFERWGVDVAYLEGAMHDARARLGLDEPIQHDRRVLPQWARAFQSGLGGEMVPRVRPSELSAVRLLVGAQEAYGLDVLAECEVENLAREGSRVVAVDCRRADGERVRLAAREVVLAAGAIGTFNLLSGSGLAKRGAFWPCVYVTITGDFHERIDASAVPPVAFLAPGGQVLEVGLKPPHQQVLELPGSLEGREEIMRRYPHLLAVRVLVPVRRPGRLRRERRRVEPLIEFAPSGDDMRSLVAGLLLAGRLLLEAGAARVLPGTRQLVEARTPRELESIESRIRKPRDLLIGIEQPQGGAVVGEVVDVNFRVRSVQNLFVADASLLPASFAYPHLTVMAMARMVGALVAGR